jgi:DNA-binding transcriptional ArsR family regulator
LSSQGTASKAKERDVAKQTVKEKTRRPKKRIEEAVQFAIGHRTRVHILILLNEGIYTAAELAEMIDEPLNNLYSHLGKMLADGSIEVAKEEEKGNMRQYWYKAVANEIYTVEEFERLLLVYRQNIVGAIVQSAFAEVMAALYAGKTADPRATVYWDWLQLDAKGRADADARTERYIEEMIEIECEATNRVAKAGEETTSMLLAAVFCERARNAQLKALRRDRSAVAK